MQMQKLIYTETHTDKHAQVQSRKLAVVISVHIVIYQWQAVKLSSFDNVFFIHV